MKTYNIVSVSGGKDSTATLLLALERGAENLQAVFADTGNEHPQTLDYLAYLGEATGVTIRRIAADFTKQIERRRAMMQAVIDGTHNQRGVYEWTPEIAHKALEILRPTGVPFLDMCLVHGRFPSTMVRFCTTELKVWPIVRQVMEPLLADPNTNEVISWQGVRAEESPSRALLPESDESNGVTNYRPILSWSAADVFAFHRKHGVKWNPLYEQGMGRVGCMPCINARKGELQEIAKRFPEEIARIAEWERIVSSVSASGAATFFTASTLGVKKASEIDLDKHGIAGMVEWSKTTRGGRQYDLIASTATDTGCKSSYGLCEAPINTASSLAE